MVTYVNSGEFIQNFESVSVQEVLTIEFENENTYALAIKEMKITNG